MVHLVGYSIVFIFYWIQQILARKWGNTWSSIGQFLGLMRDRKSIAFGLSGINRLPGWYSRLPVYRLPGWNRGVYWLPSEIWPSREVWLSGWKLLTLRLFLRLRIWPWIFLFPWLGSNIVIDFLRCQCRSSSSRGTERRYFGHFFSALQLLPRW